MRIPRIFTDLSLCCDSCVDLDGSAARHLCSALRMKVGQEITLFNGQGGEYSGELTEVGKNKVSVKVLKHRDIDRESGLKVHLAIGVSRGERMDLIVQKATELGVTEITPLFTERTEVKLNGERLAKKLRHWQQVSISACEQCQRNLVPTINNPTPLDQWLHQSDTLPTADNDQSLKLVLHHRTEKRLSEHQAVKDICLLVGPEGGLGEREIEAAIEKGFQPLALGPRVLRTETAPLAAISIMQSLWGDMG
ncbi:MAG: 16S rRNA (uracil(1498)-N(3))-methyltransferase [Porticoccaceae bacterium]|nr:16S rRNA (uracil(1498)-N(3))-methyltransferase [Porticoccaceae bacterium]